MVDKDPMKRRKEAKARQEAFAKLSLEEKSQKMMQDMQHLFRPGTKIDFSTGEVSASEPRPEKPEPAPKEEVEFIDSTPSKTGDEMKDKKGHVYIAVEDSYYISPREAADIEEANDVVVEPGWHTKARLKDAL